VWKQILISSDEIPLAEDDTEGKPLKANYEFVQPKLVTLIFTDRGIIKPSRVSETLSVFYEQKL